MADVKGKTIAAVDKFADSINDAILSGVAAAKKANEHKDAAGVVQKPEANVGQIKKVVRVVLDGLNIGRFEGEIVAELTPKQ